MKNYNLLENLKSQVVRSYCAEIKIIAINFKNIKMALIRLINLIPESILLHYFLFS